MKPTLWICLLTALVGVSACASEPASEPEAAEPTVAAEPAAQDPSGTWVGDWGPSADHRNPVTVQLNWDGSTLTGTANPGADGIEFSATSFDPETGAIAMEADAEGFNGPAHFMIEGRVEGDTMTGSWNHDDTAGDFEITRE